MLSYSATTIINASQDTIWGILTDAPGYPTWDPGVLRIEGTIAYGNKVTAFTKRDPKRAFPAKVSEFVPRQKMAWTGGMPLGLFKGVRTFTLTPQANNRIEFTLREEFSGPLLPLIASSIPNQTQTFEDFAAGLKAFAEKAS
ncbi:MAG TPA: SRPBCC domain-containing protein [Ktedonobacteraceae bacterium]